jgi:uncharacterized protein YkwD
MVNDGRGRTSMLRRLTLVAAATAVITAGSAGTAAANHYDRLLAPGKRCANQTNSGLSNNEQERIMRCMFNYARVRVGLYALRGSSLLQTSSDAKSVDMRRCNQFSHYACGRSQAYHFHRVGYTSCRTWGVGENIAWGTGSSGTVHSIMRSWLHSDPHRHAILSSRYRDLGVGLRKARSFQGRSRASIWTAHFGYRFNC